MLGVGKASGWASLLESSSRPPAASTLTVGSAGGFWWGGPGEGGGPALTLSLPPAHGLLSFLENWQPPSMGPWSPGRSLGAAASSLQALPSSAPMLSQWPFHEARQPRAALKLPTPCWSLPSGTPWGPGLGWLYAPSNTRATQLYAGPDERGAVSSWWPHTAAPLPPGSQGSHGQPPGLLVWPSHWQKVWLAVNCQGLGTGR